MLNAVSPVAGSMKSIATVEYFVGPRLGVGPPATVGSTRACPSGMCTGLYTTTHIGRDEIDVPTAVLNPVPERTVMRAGNVSIVVLVNN
jgi:hypothetical protein